LGYAKLGETLLKFFEKKNIMNFQNILLENFGVVTGIV
jgi:hypothetical protein